MISKRRRSVYKNSQLFRKSHSLRNGYKDTSKGRFYYNFTEYTNFFNLFIVKFIQILVFKKNKCKAFIKNKNNICSKNAVGLEICSRGL